jgi:hypothetical protein
VQLGELQHQLERFKRRNVTIVAVSVDSPSDSSAMRERLGIEFSLGSDPDRTVVKAFGVQNPETNELALHAVYIVDEAGAIIYRKVARRRPLSVELIDAIDAWLGTYPQTDTVDEPRGRLNVAYPRNDFQALLEVSTVSEPPPGIDSGRLADVASTLRASGGDDALIRFKAICLESTATERELLQSAARLVRSLFFEPNHTALDTGRELNERLLHLRDLETSNATDKSLATARAHVARVRAVVSANARAWRLRSVKTSLRSYREVARAARRGHSSEER